MSLARSVEKGFLYFGLGAHVFSLMLILVLSRLKKLLDLY